MDDAGRPGEEGEFTRLDRGESLRLLTTVPVGRLIFTVNALPAVRPMNFALVDGLILLRTAAGSTVARKVDGMIVAFQADELDAAACSGWSVTVTGRAALVADPDVAARYRTVPLVPWAPGIRDQFVTISTELADGLRVSRPKSCLFSFIPLILPYSALSVLVAFSERGPGRRRSSRRRRRCGW